MVYQFLPVGDYCKGLINYLRSLFLIGLLLLSVFIFTYLSLTYRRYKSCDFFPLLIALTFGILWYILLNQTEKKFWTQKTLVGKVHIEWIRKHGTLKLFKNGSFAATRHHADYSCTFQGNYTIHDKILTLNRTELVTLTDSIFTTTYTISDSVLTPKVNGFKTIRIITKYKAMD